MLKSKKKVIKLEVIKRLAEIFPQMTVTELLEYFEYCQMIKQEMEVITNEKISNSEASLSNVFS